MGTLNSNPNPNAHPKLFQDKVDWIILMIDLVILITLMVMIWQGWLQFNLPYYLGL